MHTTVARAPSQTAAGTQQARDATCTRAHTHTHTHTRQVRVCCAVLCLLCCAVLCCAVLCCARSPDLGGQRGGALRRQQMHDHKH
jgi:hypothetical protein